MDFVQLLQSTVKDLYGIEVTVEFKRLGINNLADGATMQGGASIKPDIYTMYINLDYDFKSHEEIMSLLVHEGRHLWQKKNGYGSNASTYGGDYDTYYNNPLEQDARYAEEMYKQGALYMLKQKSFHLEYMSDLNKMV